MDINKVRMTISNMYEGAVEERIMVEVQRGLENINDINTTMGARKVTFTLIMKPLDEHRHNIGIKADVKSSLCANEPIKSIATMHLDERGRPFLEELLPNANQPDLPFGNVTPFAGKGSD